MYNDFFLRLKIKKWLKKYKVERYTINKNLTVDVNGDLDLSNKQIKEFPFQFGIIEGSFDCCGNNLISLKNCPLKVGLNFYCASNQLESLQYSPENINGNFYCSINKLKNLQFAPKKIEKDFLCYANNINTLKYYPEEVGGSFNICHNLIKKETFLLFNGVVKNEIISDFGNKKEILKIIFDLIREKETTILKEIIQTEKVDIKSPKKRL